MAITPGRHLYKFYLHLVVGMENFLILNPERDGINSVLVMPSLVRCRLNISERMEITQTGTYGFGVQALKMVE